ncbi:hypothetical protein ACFX1R_041974 [Malus domestica]
MAMVPEQLIWEIVKKNNSFLVKEFGRSHAGVRFTKEPNNLLNLHSYKHSGLAKQENRDHSGCGQRSICAVGNKMAKAVGNQVADNHYRLDLKKKKKQPLQG